LTRDTTRGTGLGLYISKLLIHGMHGEIGLESSVPGEGTTFFFSLPIVKTTDPLQEATNAQTTAGTPVQIVTSKASQLSAAPRILVFEDDPYVQRMYQRLFSFKNWQIELAASGEHGVDKVIVYKPDLVLLDLMMPKVDGLGLLKQLKSEPRTKDTPVLVITNIGEANTISAAKQLGASGYLVKADFAPDQLLDEIKKHLAGA
jgi:CheY-like chemotaxis protein